MHRCLATIVKHSKWEIWDVTLAYADMASEHGDRKVEHESYSRYDQHSDVHH